MYTHTVLGAPALSYFFWMTAYMDMGGMLLGQLVGPSIYSLPSPSPHPQCIGGGTIAMIPLKLICRYFPLPLLQFFACPCMDDSFDPSIVVRVSSTILLRYICQGIKCHIPYQKSVSQNADIEKSHVCGRYIHTVPICTKMFINLKLSRY